MGGQTLCAGTTYVATTGLSKTSLSELEGLNCSNCPRCSTRLLSGAGSASTIPRTGFGTRRRTRGLTLVFRGWSCGLIALFMFCVVAYALYLSMSMPFLIHDVVHS